jgi:hypothetical protein
VPLEKNKVARMSDAIAILIIAAASDKNNNGTIMIQVT